MHKKFDSTLNTMIDTHPEEWAACFAKIAGIPPGRASVIDTDLATNVQADKIFLIESAPPCLLHLELVVNPRLGIPNDLLRYNILADRAHDLPVESVLILLRPKARASDQTGVHQRYGVAGQLITEFRYRVERVWERSVNFWFEAGLTLSPLAILTDEANADLEGTLNRFRCHLDHHGEDKIERQNLISSSYVLSGLRYNPNQIDALYRRLNMLMEESTTYQEILKTGFEKGERTGFEKGEIKALRKIIRDLGSSKFGTPNEETLQALGSITDREKLDRLVNSILSASTWNELLAID